MTRIACWQIDPVIGDLEANAELIAAAIATAVSADAEVIVLPELATGDLQADRRPELS